MKTYKYLFGPVLSRRLGRSLGIDLLPHKTCSLDCVYCECGATTKLTTKRKEYVPLKEVLKELKSFLSDKPELDHITFSGAGEPVLYSKIDKVIKYLKENYPEYKIALLTNATLFNTKKARKDVLDCDIIVPSLDAVSSNAFNKINRPHNKINSSGVLKGIKLLRKEFKGEIWLEIFIVPGLNDSKNELNMIKSAISEIRPDKIQINSLDRPGTEKWVKQLGSAARTSISKFLNTENRINLKSRVSSYSQNALDSIRQMIKRRPCTALEIAKLTGLSLNETIKYLQRLDNSGRLVKEKQNRGIFYRYV